MTFANNSMIFFNFCYIDIAKLKILLFFVIEKVSFFKKDLRICN